MNLTSNVIQFLKKHAQPIVVNVMALVLLLDQNVSSTTALLLDNQFLVQTFMVELLQFSLLPHVCSINYWKKASKTGAGSEWMD